MLCRVLCNRRCTDIEAGAAPVAVKSGCERIEILAGYDVLCSKEIVNLITGIAVTVKQDREVGVIGFYTQLNRTEIDAGNSFQISSIQVFSLPGAISCSK